MNWGRMVPNMKRKFCACLLLCKCNETMWSAYLKSHSCIHYRTSTDECLKHSYYTRTSLSFSRLFYSNFIVLWPGS